MRTPEQLAGEVEARALILTASGLSPTQARKRAGKEIAAREKRRGMAAGALSPVSPASASSLSRSHAELMEILERWVSHIWYHGGMKRYVRRRKPAQPEPITPPIGSNPVVYHEPAQPLSADPKLQKAFPAPLVVADFSSAKIIPDSEFSQRFRDQTTANWRQSIQQNEQINKEREARSLALQNRNRGRYLG
jgi:hypothetical protein